MKHSSTQQVGWLALAAAIVSPQPITSRQALRHVREQIKRDERSEAASNAAA